MRLFFQLSNSRNAVEIVFTHFEYIEFFGNNATNTRGVLTRVVSIHFGEIIEYFRTTENQQQEWVNAMSECGDILNSSFPFAWWAQEIAYSLFLL